MQIGLSGFSNNTNKLIDKLFKEKNVSVAGFFSDKEKNTSNDIKKFQSAEELIKNSDIIYFIKPDSAFQISKMAIKSSRHLFFDSPYMLPKHEFEYLFELSKETNCLIKFNQQILQKRIYQHTKGKLEPTLLKVKRAINLYRNHKKIIEKTLFDFISISRDNIQSGIRKIYFQPVQGENELPVTFSLNVIFDNGNSSELLFSRITQDEQYTLYSYQKDRNITIDLINNTSLIHSFNEKEIEKQEIKKANNQNKLAKELCTFAEQLNNNKDKPLTIREENQHLLDLTDTIVNKVLN